MKPKDYSWSSSGGTQISKPAKSKWSGARASTVARYKNHKEIRSLAGPDPLNIHAIGDSWFEYPLDGNIPIPFCNFGIVGDSQLGAKGSPHPNILSRAEHGQASTAVLSWENQSIMVNDWIDHANWTNGKLDAILVSMGGDDIVGDKFAIVLLTSICLLCATCSLQARRSSATAMTMRCRMGSPRRGFSARGCTQASSSPIIIRRTHNMSSQT